MRTPVRHEQAPVGAVLILGEVRHVVGEDGDAMRGDHPHDPTAGVRKPGLPDDRARHIARGAYRGKVHIPDIHGESGQHVVDRALQKFYVDIRFHRLPPFLACDALMRDAASAIRSIAHPGGPVAGKYAVRGRFRCARRWTAAGGRAILSQVRTGGQIPRGRRAVARQAQDRRGAGKRTGAG